MGKLWCSFVEQGRVLPKSALSQLWSYKLLHPVYKKIWLSKDRRNTRRSLTFGEYISPLIFIIIKRLTRHEKIIKKDNLSFILCVMFWTVFLAVLAALFVYKYLTTADKKQLDNLSSIIQWGFLIFLWVLAITAVIGFIDDNWDKILNALKYIGCFFLAMVFFYFFITISSYIKFRERKKLWLIKGEKKSFRSVEFEDEWYKSLTKEEKEKEDKRSKKATKRIFRFLVTIPLTLILWLMVRFISAYISWHL